MIIRVRKLLCSLFVCICLLCGAAQAEDMDTWDTKALLDFFAERYLQQPATHLYEYIKPIDSIYENDAIRVRFIDAICDAPSYFLTWTVENKTDELLYIIREELLEGETFSCYSYGGYHLFLNPGETVAGGMLMIQEPGNALPHHERTQHEIAFTFDVLHPLAEIVHIEECTDINRESDESLHVAYEQYNAEGKIVDIGSGLIDFGHEFEQSDGNTGTIAERCVNSGKFEHDDTLSATLMLAHNTWNHTALPDGQPIEKDNGSYILRVTEASLAPNNAAFQADIIFHEERYAKEYGDARVEEYHNGRWGIKPVDSNGNDIPCVMGSIGIGYDHNYAQPPQRQSDGTWLWQFAATLNGLFTIPDVVILMPYWQPTHDAQEDVTYFPEEAITLSFIIDAQSGEVLHVQDETAGRE